ncbi:DUF1146 family protein [Abiotrophia defectiva]|uniref:DUF1146 family protein n=1 Tax=Abiotrophia defectiva TaxID=46125 RepID=UPI0030CBCA2D
MQTSVYGMAVLCLRLIILGMSLLIFRGVNWNQLMRQNAKQGAHAVYVMVSLAVGHLVGSFMIEMTESLQNLLLGFLK